MSPIGEDPTRDSELLPPRPPRRSSDQAEDIESKEPLPAAAPEEEWEEVALEDEDEEFERSGARLDELDLDDV